MNLNLNWLAVKQALHEISSIFQIYAYVSTYNTYSQYQHIG